MKRILSFFAFAAMAVAGYGAATDANNIRFEQRNATGTQWLTKYFTSSGQIDTLAELSIELGVAAGASILVDAGVPADGTGNDGDLYINATTDEYYRKVAGTWGSALGDLTGSTGATGSAGADGADAFVYVAWASAGDGTGFTTTFDANLDYIAILSTTTAIASPVVGDFAGLWKNYKGATGDTGPAGSGVSDGDKGDITVGGSGTTFTIDNAVVTLAKQANLAQDRLIGRVSSGAGVPESLAGTDIVAVVEADGINLLTDGEALRVPPIAYGSAVGAGGTLTLTDAHVGKKVTVTVTGNFTVAISATAVGNGVIVVQMLNTKDSAALTVTLPDGLINPNRDPDTATSSSTLTFPLSSGAIGLMAFISDGTTWNQYRVEGDTFDGYAAQTATFENKTIDANATGNVVKGYGYLVLTHPHVFGSGVTQQTTVTANTYGQALFANATDKATNYVEYYVVVPPDFDSAVEWQATYKTKLSNTDTGDFEYEISFDSVADSAAYAGTLGDAISLAFTADASGAQNDAETAGPTTLTGWAAAMTAGQLMVVRVARDGDHASDTSTVDSYSGPLVLRYGFTQ